MRATRFAPALIRSVPGLALKRWVWSLVRRREFAYSTTTPRGWRITGHTRDWIQRHLYYFGLWEPNLSAWMEERLLPGDVFIDVGANIGYFTMLAANRVGPSGRVVAIEAMPAIFQHLAAHVAANSLVNTRLINEAAVGPGEPREAFMYWGDAGNVGSSGLVRQATQPQSVKVAAGSLRRILTPEELRRARLIKVDVEGVEARTIRGLELERGDFDPRLELIVEMSAGADTDPADLLRYLARLGFSPYELREDHHCRRYAYPARAVSRPQRVRQPLTAVHNVIFSRIDAEFL